MVQLDHTILLVDDSPVNLEILKEALSRYKTIGALDGDTAIETAFSRNKPDLILLDVVMPGMDGYEVCRILKSNELSKDIPIIFITGQNDSTSIIKGFEAGAVDYITKPFNVLELKARIKTQLSVKMARDQNQRLINKVRIANKKLADSIEYGKKVQRAGLPQKAYLNEVMPEHFIMFKPRDVVGGDFYWVKELGEKLIVAAADCTGHGVPGAFMSMFGIAYLNETAGKNGFLQPAEIINQLRRVVINSLKQDDEDEVKDGMDISIVSIDKSTKQIEYAGAFNAMLLIRNNELTIYQADHIPMVIGETDKPYTNHVIDCKTNDCIYLYTDGFPSQFGGVNNKKLMQKGFRELLLKHHHEPMSEQLPVYENFLTEWKGVNDQIDDILLIGIRL